MTLDTKPTGQPCDLAQRRADILLRAGLRVVVLDDGDGAQERDMKIWRGPPHVYNKYVFEQIEKRKGRANLAIALGARMVDDGRDLVALQVHRSIRRDVELRIARSAKLNAAWHEWLFSATAWLPGDGRQLLCCVRLDPRVRNTLRAETIVAADAVGNPTIVLRGPGASVLEWPSRIYTEGYVEQVYTQYGTSECLWTDSLGKVGMILNFLQKEFHRGDECRPEFMGDWCAYKHPDSTNASEGINQMSLKDFNRSGFLKGEDVRGWGGPRTLRIADYREGVELPDGSLKDVVDFEPLNGAPMPSYIPNATAGKLLYKLSKNGDPRSLVGQSVTVDTALVRNPATSQMVHGVVLLEAAPSNGQRAQQQQAQTDEVPF